MRKFISALIAFVFAVSLVVPSIANATKYSVLLTTTWPANAGGIASASSNWSGSYPVSSVNDGNRINDGTSDTLWKDTTSDVWGDWVEIDFNGAKTIDHAIVYTTQEGPPYVEPTDTMTTVYGITGFDFQYWNGTSWITVASVTSNTHVKIPVSFTAVSTTKIRVSVTGGSHFSRIVEIEAYTVDNSASGGYPSFNVALAAPPQTVTGQDVIYSTLTKATNAKNSFKAYSDSIAASLTTKGAFQPTLDYSIVSTAGAVTSVTSTVAPVYAPNYSGSETDALTAVNALDPSAVAPTNLDSSGRMQPEFGGEVVVGLVYAGFILVSVGVMTNVITLPTVTLDPNNGWETFGGGKVWGGNLGPHVDSN